MLGLPFAFASHFAPDALEEALDVYRRGFQPSAQLEKPYVMLGFNCFAADSDAEGELLASSMQQAFVALRSGRPGKLTAAPGHSTAWNHFYYRGDAPTLKTTSCPARSIGVAGAGASRTQKAFIARTGADELMVTSQIFDHQARLRSFAIAAEAMATLARSARRDLSPARFAGAKSRGAGVVAGA